MKPILDYPAEEFQQQVRVMRRTAGFVEPPVPGITDIVPLTDAGELLEEGRAPRNYLGGYGLGVDAGKVCVYRVLKPERATLSPRMGADGEVGDQATDPSAQPKGVASQGNGRATLAGD